MARLTSTIDTSNSKMDFTAPSTGGGKKNYQLIAPDFYTAILTELKFDTYMGKSGSHINPDSTNGKWTYAKLTPELTFLNENSTQINRQDFVMGVVDDNGALFRPDGDTSKFAMWAGDKGAMFMLKALGLLEQTGAKTFKFDHDTEHILDRLIRVKTGIAGYVKGANNFDAVQLHNLFSGLYGSDNYTFEDVPALQLLYNVSNGMSNVMDCNDGEDIEHTVEACRVALSDIEMYTITHQETRLKLKNVITGFYTLSARDAEEHDAYVLNVETGISPVFTNEVGYEHWVSLRSGEETAGW